MLLFLLIYMHNNSCHLRQSQWLMENEQHFAVPKSKEYVIIAIASIGEALKINAACIYSNI